MVQVTTSLAAIAYVQSCNAYLAAVKEQRPLCTLPAWAAQQDNIAAMKSWGCKKNPVTSTTWRSKLLSH